MPAPPFQYTAFQGGLDTKDSPYLLDEEGVLPARDLSNVQGTTAGWIVKRNGLQTLGTPPVTLTSLFALESVTPTVLVGAGSTFLYKVAAAGTVTQIKSGLTSNARWEFCSAPIVSGQGPLFGVNGADTPQQWDGAAGTTSAWTNASGGVGVPNGKYCLYANNQVFIAGVAATPSTLFWSAIADPTNWDPASLTGAGSMQFDPNDGQAITGIGRVGPYLLVAKPRKLWVLVDPGTGTSRRVSDTVGCVAHRSIASGPEGTYFLAEDRGVYLFNGSKLEPISDKIQPTIDSIQPAVRSQAAGVCLAGHYYLSVPIAGASSDTTLDWDSTLGSWWKHSFGSNQFSVWHPSGTAQLYSAKATAAIVDRCFVPGVLQDNGANFAWVWRGPWQSPTFYRRRRFPTPYFRKRMRQMRYSGVGQVDLSLAKDFFPTEILVRSNVFSYDGSTATFGGSDIFAESGLFGGSPIATQGRVYGQGVANAWSVVFGATANAPAFVSSYTLMISDRKDSVTS